MPPEAARDVRRPPGAADAGRGRRPGARRARAAWLALALVAASWPLLRAAPTAWIEERWLSRWLPPASDASAAMVDALPWSLTALSAAALLLALGGWIVGARRPGSRHRLVWAAAALLLLGPTFELAWGMGYRRVPLEERLGLGSEAPTPDAAWRALDLLLLEAHAHAPYDPDRVARGAPWWDAALAAGSACVADVDAYVSGRPAPLRLPTRVRALPAGALLGGGFAGVQAPWWREPHVDGGLPPAAALATGLHELAHSAGWAGEAETDALAVLAGLSCPDPDVRFATALHALPLVRSEIGRLPHVDPAWRLTLDARWSALPAAATAAWSASAAAQAEHRSPAVERAATTAYGAYLRAHGVSDGMADYGRAGILVVAALDHCGEDPGAPWCAP